MLQELKVDNFLSWINLSFKPSSENLIVGLNNTGKTNLCRIMQFLSLTAALNLNDCASAIGIPIFNFQNFSFKEATTTDFYVRASIPFRDEEAVFEYNLTISSREQSSSLPILEVSSEELRVSCEGFTDAILLENKLSKVRLLHEGEAERGNMRYFETTAPPEMTMLNRLYDPQTNPRANCFKDYLRMWQYYNLSDANMRNQLYVPNQQLLSPDGSNLSSVIHDLKKADERTYRQLLEAMRSIEPNFDVINFFGGGAERQISMYFATSDRKNIPAWTASGGTLRYLALAYILIAQPALQVRPLMIIEEPENGIYVGLLKNLLRMAELAPSRPQIIFTSHSPYVIDLFEKHLDGIFVTKKKQHSSSIGPIDKDKIAKRLEDFPLGELHFRDMLA